MSITTNARRRHAGRRVRDAIAVFEKDKGTIVFNDAEEGQTALKPPASHRPSLDTTGERSELRTPIPASSGDTRSQQGQPSSRNPKSIGEWTTEKVYVLSLTRSRADGQLEGMLPHSGPGAPGGLGKDTSIDKKQTLGQTTSYTTVAQRMETIGLGVQMARQGAETTRQGIQTARQGAETSRLGVQTARQGVQTTRQGVQTARQGIEMTRQGVQTARPGVEHPKSRVADLLNEAHRLMEELVMQGMTSPHQLEQTGCLTHCTCEQQLQALHADVWRLERENAALHHELASMKWKEERNHVQLDEVYGAYFSLQQCMGRRVERVKVGRTKSAVGIGESASERTKYLRPLSRAASSQESSV